MADFGICENLSCKLSYHSPILSGLPGRIETIHGRERRNAEFSHILPSLKPFTTFFQFGIVCSNCGQVLYRAIQPTANLQKESDENVRRSKLNALLDAGYQLQAWSVL